MKNRIRAMSLIIALALSLALTMGTGAFAGVDAGVTETDEVEVAATTGLLADGALIDGGAIADGLADLAELEGSCTSFFMGPDTTENGSFLWGRSEDAGGNAKRFDIRQAADYAPGTPYYGGEGNFTYVYPEHAYRYILVKDSQAINGYEHEVGGPVDEAYAEAGMNEMGVSMSATVTLSGAKTQISDIDANVRAGGLRETDMVTLVLMEAESARHGCEILARIIDEKGAAGREGIMLGDANETWFFQTLSGHQYAAVKCPRDYVGYSPNITGNVGAYDEAAGGWYVDVANQEDVIASDGLISTAIAAGVFVGHPSEDAEPDSEKTMIKIADSYANGPSDHWAGRIRTGYGYLHGISTNEAYQAQFPTQTKYLDYFSAPRASGKYSLYEALRILGTRGEGTEWEVVNPVGNGGSPASPTTLECHVFETRPNMDPAMATIEWFAMGPAEFSVYLPFYGNLVKEVYGKYSGPDNAQIDYVDFDNNSMDRIFRGIYNQISHIEPTHASSGTTLGGESNATSAEDRHRYGDGVLMFFECYQKELISQQAAVDEVMEYVLAEGGVSAAEELATKLSVGLAAETYGYAKSILAELYAFRQAGTAGKFIPSASAEAAAPRYLEFAKLAIAGAQSVIPAPGGSVDFTIRTFGIESGSAIKMRGLGDWVSDSVTTGDRTVVTIELPEDVAMGVYEARFEIEESVNGEITVTTSNPVKLIVRGKASTPAEPGDMLFSTLVELEGQRMHGTPNEKAAIDFVKAQFDSIGGYVTETQAIPITPANDRYSYSGYNQESGMVDVSDGDDVHGRPFPNSEEFGGFDGIFHDFGSYLDYSLPDAGDLEASGGKVYGTLRFLNSPDAADVNAAIADIEALCGDGADVTGLIVSRDAASGEGQFTLPNIGGSPATDASVVSMPLRFLEKAAQAGERGAIEKVVRFVPEHAYAAYATKPAKIAEPDLVLIVSAHVDDVWNSFGMSDNASGVAAVVELARRFKDVRTDNIELVFATTTGEEYANFEGATFLGERLKEQGKDVVAINMNMDMIGAREGAIGGAGAPVDTMGIGVWMGDNGIEPEFNLPAHLLVSFAEEVEWAQGIENVEMFSFGSSDNAVFSQDFGIESSRAVYLANPPLTGTRQGNHYENTYHTSRDTVEESYSYDRHLKATNLMENAILKAIELNVTKRAVFLVEGDSVTLKNADQLFAAYDRVVADFTSDGATATLEFTADAATKTLAGAAVSEIGGVMASGQGIANHNESIDERFNIFTTALVGKKEVLEPADPVSPNTGNNGSGSPSGALAITPDDGKATEPSAEGPDEDVPGEGVSGEDVPGEGAPGEGIPGEDVSGEGGQVNGDGQVPGGAAQTDNPFRDVAEADWFFSDVMWAFEKGIASGVAADMFAPETSLSRGMAVTMLHRMDGSPDAAELENPFADVAGDAWYADGVKWAAANGIVLGVTEESFVPDAMITRQDLASVILRYMTYKGVSVATTMEYVVFADEAEIAEYAKSAIQTLFKLDVVTGVGQGLIDPTGEATRAQAAAMLRRLEIVSMAAAAG